MWPSIFNVPTPACINPITPYTAAPFSLLGGGWWETRAQRGIGFWWRLSYLSRPLCVTLCFDCHFLARFPSSQSRRHNTVVIAGHQPFACPGQVYSCQNIPPPPRLNFQHASYSSTYDWLVQTFVSFALPLIYIPILLFVYTLVVSLDYHKLCPTSALLKRAEILQIQWNALVCFRAYRNNRNTHRKKPSVLGWTTVWRSFVSSYSVVPRFNISYVWEYGSKVQKG